MKIILKDYKNGKVKLKTENNEDLWTLKKIINEGDIITASTTRVMKKEEEQEGKRRAMTIKLTTEKIEFMESSFTLKILGKIKEAPENVPLGSYHSFNINVGDELSIKKEEWNVYEKNELNKSEKEKIKILITVLDANEATFALITNEVKELYDIEANLPRKDMPDYTKKTNDYYTSLVKQLQNLNTTHKPERIIIAGPGFASETLTKTLKEKDKSLASKTTQAHTNHTGMTGVKELITNDTINKALSENEISKETRIIEDFFNRVSKEKLIRYGYEKVSQAIEKGAVDTLLISEGLVIDYRERKRFKEIETLISKAEKSRSRIEFIGTKHDAGKRFYRFGGIGAILRYEV